MKKSIVLSIFLLTSFFFGFATIHAENIDPLKSGSQYAYQENTGWMNAEPQGDGGPGVTVYTDHIEGYIWAENIGWINLSPTSYGGVINNGESNLSGYAWSENTGWINFAPSGGGVTIDIFTGKFSGWAWGENIGWINFHITTQVQNATRTSWSLWEEDGDPENNWDADPDGDSLVNLEDPDADNDGLNNDAEMIMWGNSWRADFDLDGLYNLIDADADGDGLLDGYDPYPFSACLADFEGDGDVDSYDLSRLATGFGHFGISVDADVDGDMDGKDLYEMAVDFGRDDCMP